jgi:hypothetical protein
MRIDPTNRLVANALEADWNQALHLLAEAQEECERQREADRRLLEAFCLPCRRAETQASGLSPAR